MPSPSRQARRAQPRQAQARQAQARRASRARQRSGSPGFFGRVPIAGWLALGAPLLILIAVIAVVSLGGSSSGGESVAFTGSGYPNGNTSNTRDSGGPIDAATVSK